MLNLPNALTVARVVAAPLVAAVLALGPRPAADWAALVLFVGAAATDWLDGRLARAWNQVTPLGRMLDPIADKAMATIALAVLLGVHGLSAALALPVAVILLRETLVAGLREFLKGAEALSVTTLAKWKTTAQLTAIAVLLGVEPARTLGGDAAAAAVMAGGLALLWAAAALTAVTGWDYFRKGLALMMAAPGGSGRGGAR
jgi:CDP-diacylglycerol--glycerol-3-phosphate 3-phosphatidyltransferase